MNEITPKSADELCDAVKTAAQEKRPLEIRGGGSKARAGAPRSGATLVSMSHFSDIEDYAPSELVLTAGAGARLSDIEALLSENQQMLGFEPFDHGPVYGAERGLATLGGVVAAGVAGSRRVTAGGARDHVLGFEAVSGRGERFIAGGKVVKNVTGYDLPKLMAGSWGRLAALTQVTLKVVPRPRASTTLICENLDAPTAINAMTAAMGAPADVAAAAHAPNFTDAGAARPVTAFRLEGFEASVAARASMLERILSPYGAVRAFSADEATRFWASLREASALSQDPEASLWRVHSPASRASEIITALEPLGARWLMDWAGALIWIAAEEGEAPIREAAAQAGGHAMLMRGSEAARAKTPMFHPQPAVKARLSMRVRRAFDPAGVFETSRFLDNPDAD